MESGKNFYPEFCKVFIFLENAEAILQGSKEANRRIVVLNTKINYGGMLRHHYFKETFSEIKNHIFNLGDRIDHAQRKLLSYFMNLAKFDQHKLNIDINAHLNSWDEMVDALRVKNSLFKTRMEKLINYALKVNFGDRIELATNAVLKTVSLFFSMITGITNIPEKITALRQASMELAKARVESKRLGNILQKLVPKLQIIVRNILGSTSRNYKTYQAVNTFFKTVKANNFTKFEPAIDKIKLAELEETLCYIIENICIIIKDTGSMTGTEISGQKAEEGLCYHPKVTVREIIQLYSEFIDYEVHLIKSFEELARSKVAEHGAKQLWEELSNTINNKIELLITQLKVFLLLQKKNRNLIKESCSYITYLNHGVKEPFCKSLINNTNFHVIDKLINYKINVDICENQVVSSPTLVSISVSFNTGKKNFSN